ncbi:hypothetical protein ACWGIU_31025 [Streptomyces sp. NPDC054840]
MFRRFGALPGIGRVRTGGALSHWLRRRPQGLERQRRVGGGGFPTLGALASAAATAVGP